MQIPQAAGVDRFSCNGACRFDAVNRVSYADSSALNGLLFPNED